MIEIKKLGIFDNDFYNIYLQKIYGENTKIFRELAAESDEINIPNNTGCIILIQNKSSSLMFILNINDKNHIYNIVAVKIMDDPAILTQAEILFKSEFKEILFNWIWKYNLM